MPKHTMTVLDLLQFLSDKPLDMPVHMSSDGCPPNDEAAWTIISRVRAEIGRAASYNDEHSVRYGRRKEWDVYAVWNPKEPAGRAASYDALILHRDDDDA